MWDKTSPTGEKGYFDYGLLHSNYSISSANHYYNPRGDDGKGYYFKKQPIQEEKTTFYIIGIFPDVKMFLNAVI